MISFTFGLYLIVVSVLCFFSYSRYLQLSLDENEIRKQDTVMVIANVAANPAGRVLTWRFVKQNWEELAKRYCTDKKLKSRVEGHWVNLFIIILTSFDIDPIYIWITCRYLFNIYNFTVNS